MNRELMAWSPGGSRETTFLHRGGRGNPIVTRKTWAGTWVPAEPFQLGLHRAHVATEGEGRSMTTRSISQLGTTSTHNGFGTTAQ